MKSSMKHVGSHRQQGGKRLRLFGSLVMICTALNIIVSVKNKQDGVVKDASSFGMPHEVLPVAVIKSITKKNLLVIDAVGRQSNLQYNVHAVQHHFHHDDWECLVFLYVHQTVIPDDDDDLEKLRTTYKCTIVRTPGVSWGTFLQFLPPMLTNQFQHIAIMLDDTYLPTKGDRPINIPRLLETMQIHNISSMSPAIIGDSHGVFEPPDHGGNCVREIGFIETYVQIFTTEAWQCYYSMLHHDGARGWCYDLCFRGVCGVKLAVDNSQAAFHLERSLQYIPQGLKEEESGLNFTKQSARTGDTYYSLSGNWRLCDVCRKDHVESRNILCPSPPVDLNK